ncbi:uncharacterized [Tachysurus ichikawai]
MRNVPLRLRSDFSADGGGVSAMNRFSKMVLDLRQGGLRLDPRLPLSSVSSASKIFPVQTTLTYSAPLRAGMPRRLQSANQFSTGAMTRMSQQRGQRPVNYGFIKFLFRL